MERIFFLNMVLPYKHDFGCWLLAFVCDSYLKAKSQICGEEYFVFSHLILIQLCITTDIHIWSW